MCVDLNSPVLKTAEIPKKNANKKKEMNKQTNKWPSHG